MNKSTTNPYKPQAGYTEAHEFAVTGFGITLNTLNYFLFEHQLSLIPKAIIKSDDGQIEQNDIDDYLLVDANEVLNANHLKTEVFTASNADFVGLIIEDLPVIDKNKIQLTVEQAHQDLKDAINVLYDIPTSLQDQLVEFIFQYANTVNICNFN